MLETGSTESVVPFPLGSLQMVVRVAWMLLSVTAGAFTVTSTLLLALTEQASLPSPTVAVATTLYSVVEVGSTVMALVVSWVFHT